VHYNEHWDPKNYYKNNFFKIHFFDKEHTFKGDHSTWNAACNMHEIKISLLRNKIIYNFDNNNAHTTNWENVKSQTLKLATKNDNNIWMDKFSNANIGFSSQNIIDCIGLKTYNICNEYIVNPCVSVSTIFNSTNIDIQDQIMPTHEFHSLLQKKNNEQCFIFDDVMYRKKQNSNEPIHLFVIGSVGNIFTLMH